jgi:hypothetical protein
MPPQKNSGNKKGKRESGVSVKNRKFISELLQDIRQNDDLADIHIGRVTRKLGNGRVDVFFVAKEKEKTFDENGEEIEKIVHKSYEKQAVIRGTFRGKGKHSVWIDVGSPVIIADTGLNSFVIMAVLTREQVTDISKEMFVDERVLNGISENADGVNQTVEFDATELSTEDIDNI